MAGLLPEAASSYAHDLDWLLLFITIIVGAWFILAELTLLYFALRYRRKKNVKAAYLPGRTLRAMCFVLVPCAIILGFDLVIDGVASPIWDKIKTELPAHDEVVRITGEQWAWRFTDPGPDGKLDTADDVESVNEFHVPVGKTIQFELTAKDVLHSFFVPNLRLKQDAIPGRRIKGWFKVTRAGKFEIVCAEICGFGHTLMKAQMVAESPEAYRAWVDSKAAPPAPPAQAPAHEEEKKQG